VGLIADNRDKAAYYVSLLVLCNGVVSTAIASRRHQAQAYKREYGFILTLQIYLKRWILMSGNQTTRMPSLLLLLLSGHALEQSATYSILKGIPLLQPSTSAHKYSDSNHDDFKTHCNIHSPPPPFHENFRTKDQHPL